jgi:hypothetical protein
MSENKTNSAISILSLNKVILQNLDGYPVINDYPIIPDAAIIPGTYRTSGQDRYTRKLGCEQYTNTVNSVNIDCCSREETNCFVYNTDPNPQTTLCRSAIGICPKDYKNDNISWEIKCFLDKTKPYCNNNGGVGTFSFNYGNICDC